jgi:hypothetical protein
MVSLARVAQIAAHAALWQYRLVLMVRGGVQQKAASRRWVARCL